MGEVRGIGYTLSDALIALLEPLYRACPALLDDSDDDDGITVPTALLQTLGDVGQTTEQIFSVAFAEQVTELGIFTRLCDRLERNLVAASGGNPASPASFNRAPKLPSQADAKDPAQLVSSYLGGTPLSPLFDQTLDFTIPTKTRFEHHHIVAGSGHGKTQTLQYLIAHDLEAVADGNRTVIVDEMRAAVTAYDGYGRAGCARDYPPTGRSVADRSDPVAEPPSLCAAYDRRAEVAAVFHASPALTYGLGVWRGD